MNQLISLSAEQHRRIQLLLPWYINQTLDRHERQQVENHLRSCIQCRRELVGLRKLSEAVNRTSELEAAAEMSFSKLRDKLRNTAAFREKPEFAANLEAPAGLVAGAGSGLSGNTVYRFKRFLRLNGGMGKRLAIAASLLLALIPLAFHAWQPPSTAGYYTLSAATPEASVENRLHVVFSKSLPDAGIDALLAQIHAQRIEGPNSAGAYTIRLEHGKDSQDLTAAIAFLRKQQDVMLAEPLTPR